MTSGVPTGARGTGPGSWEPGEASPCEVVVRWPSCRGIGPLPEVLGPEHRARAAAPHADADTWLQLLLQAQRPSEPFTQAAQEQEQL